MRRFVVRYFKMIQHPIMLVRAILMRLWLYSRLMIVKSSYTRVVKRIGRKIHKGCRIKVLFVVENSSKWKTQSLYDAMVKSDRYDPLVLVTRIDDAGEWKYYDLSQHFFEIQRYLLSRGCKCELACDPRTGEVVDLAKFRPDVVFFQEPYMSLRGQTVWDVSRYALCCYVPYAVEYEEANFTQKIKGFHDFIFANFVWNENMRRDAERFYPQRYRAGKFVNGGHTIFDELQPIDNEKNEGYVIYAPHFSFPIDAYCRGYMVATFKWSGKEVLEYAKSHPHFKWVFKPHPRLRTELRETGGWSKEEVDAYYAEWERVGMACYTSSYTELFRKSKAMITDCGSFLLEYAATGMPLIHLKLKETNVSYRESVKPLINSYYKAENKEQMMSWFRLILEENKDPLRDKRIEEVRKQGIVGRNAAQNIMAFFDGLWGVQGGES